MNRVILGVDPGSAKCGLAVLGGEGRTLARRIVPTEQLGAEAIRLCEQFSPQVVAMGASTGAKAAVELIRRACPSLPLELVEESRSTEEARRRYWQEHPPRGLWSFIPLAWRVPPEPVDDYAALVLAERLAERLARHTD